MHLVTPPPPPLKHNSAQPRPSILGKGDDSNTQEIVTVVMQNFGEAWGKQGAVWCT